MPQIIHSHKGKRAHYFKRTTCNEKQQKDRKPEKKECPRKNSKFNVMYQDFVMDYNHPEESAVNMPNLKAIQKRKLRNDDDYDWDWAPYPRRLKTEEDDESTFDNSCCLSDGMEESQIVPNWDDNEQESNDLLFCEAGAALGPRCADIHIVTIDEVIEFDSSKLPTSHAFEEEGICFDMEQICEIVGTQEVIGKNLTIDKQENDLDVLLAFTNPNARMILYAENSIKFKGLKQMESLSDVFNCDESSENEVEDQWANDCQVEEFKLARCFKCRRKVYNMQDCPSHLMKARGTMITK